MTIMIYNTLTRKKEEFLPIKDDQVSMYVCGPTVYDKAHVGHAMSVLVFDVIRRYLEFRGYRVHHVTNYTDVDDKIIQRAAVEGVETIEVAERYIAEFDQHLQDLDVLPATEYPRATEEIDRIIDAVSDLIEAGYAYEIEGDVYYRVERFSEYGKLSGRKLEDMEAGSRVGVDSRKEHPMDFALWKAAKPQEPSWESPWGRGRPGWHIECSVMTISHLGEHIDIHGGGNDLVFPHHENEIAQSEALTGKQFANYWVHNGMMQLSGAKMSKSLGNLVTVEKFLEEHEPTVLRMMVLNSSYRSPLTFNDESIEHAQKALKRMRSALRPPSSSGGDYPGKLTEIVKQTREKFLNAMDDDFNTAGALGFLFELIKEINLARDQGAGEEILKEGQDELKQFMGILGVDLERPWEVDSDADLYIELLIDVREQLREEKLWELADHIRDRLLELDVVLEDKTEGTDWRWK